MGSDLTLKDLSLNCMLNSPRTGIMDVSFCFPAPSTLLDKAEEQINKNP
jgi:hypothetical protein